MTARTDTSHGEALGAASHFLTHPPARLRSRLLAELRDEGVRFEVLRATFAALTADSAKATDRDRAVAALRMFGTRAVIEEIEDAIVRIETGRYGTCQSCLRPISLERLEMIPYTRCCAFCPAAAAFSVDRRRAAPAPGAS